MPIFFTYSAPGQPITVGIAAAVNTPYTALPSDFLIKVDASSGQQITVTFESSPATGSYHKVLWWKWISSSPPPIVSAGGKQLTPYGQQTQTSGALATSTAITQQGDSPAWLFDGTQWLLVG